MIGGNFNPRPPCGGRHQAGTAHHQRERFQSTSSVWRTTFRGVEAHGVQRISIHVLRVEDDLAAESLENARRISIHVLRVEDDPVSFSATLPTIFQSTSSVWRTTLPLTPSVQRSAISIHVLRVEDDGTRSSRPHPSSDFNPRPPCGGRRSRFFAVCAVTNFNPRPPCGGRQVSMCAAFAAINFNPRPPCGGRLFGVLLAVRIVRFQSTSSVWRTTSSLAFILIIQHISIHVLRVEDDFTPVMALLIPSEFQSTSSVWRTTS